MEHLERDRDRRHTRLAGLTVLRSATLHIAWISAQHSISVYIVGRITTKNSSIVANNIMQQSLADSKSIAFDASATFSLELDIDTDNNRTYPSVPDYYNAKSKDSVLPLNLQPGLSNYSGIKLGDDRITVGESVLSGSYRQPVEHLMSIAAPSKDLTKHTRIREYESALKKVGDTEINRLERVMKDKLFQRSYATSSPFQVRKAFKFFDREVKLTIPIEGFTRALEFLGFQFAEIQNLALFARYDEEYTGEIYYMEFITNAMFYPAVEPDFGVQKTSIPAESLVKKKTVVEDSEEVSLFVLQSFLYNITLS